MQIRTATREDIETLVSFQIHMAKESEEMILDLATVTKGVTHLFDNPQTGYYLIAELDQQPAGCLLVLKEWSDWRNGDVLWIHSVYIATDFRRQGVFRKMYAHLKEKVLSDDSLRGLRLYVDKRNTRAQKTYQTLGMTDAHYQLYEWMR